MDKLKFNLSICGMIIVLASILVIPAEKNIKLLDVPFFAQKSQYECGVAALLSLLKWKNLPADYNEVKKEIYSESAKGTFPISIELYLRKNKIPHKVVQGNLAMIHDLIMQNIPSIALLQRKIAIQTINHYYVVVGIKGDWIIVHDGSNANQKIKNPDFLKQWSKSNYWMLYLEKATGGKGDEGDGGKGR